jgi:hypothetical protein
MLWCVVLRTIQLRVRDRGATMGGERSISLSARPIAALSANLGGYVAVAMLGLLSAAAMMVALRRLAGALTHPLEPGTLLAIGVLVATAAAAIRLGWLWPPRTGPTPLLDQAVMLVTSLAVAALVFGLHVADTSVIGMFFLATLLGGEESWAWAWYVRRCGSIPVSGSLSPVPHPLSPVPTLRPPLSVDLETAILPDEVTQQLTRSRAADGTEEISGLLRLAFAAGQRTGSIHVAFCPPLDAAPELEVEQIDGPEARIKQAQLLPYGARLDLKLAAATEEPASVLLQFSARTTIAER